MVATPVYILSRKVQSVDVFVKVAGQCVVSDEITFKMVDDV